MELTPWWIEWGRVAVRLLPVLGLAAWCLWAIDWRKAWPVLHTGGWVALVLIAVMAAVAWSLVFPVPLWFGTVYIPNILWQTGALALLVGLVLACGWLQGRIGSYPPEVSFDPPPPEAGEHDHHDHAPPVTISHPTH